MRQWLKELRNQNGFSQQVVADKSDISRSFYTQIEAGNKNPTVTVAKRISDTLGFDWTLFFTDECSLKEQKEQEVS